MTESPDKSETRGPSLRKWVWGYVIVALWWFGVSMYERHVQEEKKRKELERSVQELREGVRRGEAGEAFSRLFAEEHQEFLDRRRREEDASH